jgi:CubicO group peptidase (beta-lactamase class C family)
MRLARLIFLFSFVIVAVGTGCSSELPKKLREGQKRDQLEAETLLDPEHIPNGPVHNDYFTPRGDAGPALHEFKGTLSVARFEMQDTIPAETPRSQEGRYFPGFSAEFFTYEDFLVPVNREILPSESDECRWCIILSPGKIWSEAKDDGMSRAAFPFVLTTQTSNEVHNGLATFLYDEDTVSEFFFQITQETSAWNRNDYWGQFGGSYEPGVTENEVQLRSEFAAELDYQVDIKSFEELDSMVGEELLEAFNSDLEPEDISAAGLIVNDTIYLQPQLTRYGESPYPRATRHGVFSVTKSMGALVAMLRLSQKYGDEVFDLLLADYVDITVNHDGWEGVTFRDALSMATGVGEIECNTPPGHFTVDEDQDKFSDWLGALSRDEKMDVVFSYSSYDWGPGEVACYNSVNTFVLSAAMDSFLKEQEGAQADIWTMVEEEVYKPIGILHSPIMRTVEPDGSLGLPIMGYGIYPTVDDTAKITKLLQNEGRHEGEQLLSPTKLAEALYQTGEQGLSINQPNQYGESRYLYSFWSRAHCDTNGSCYQVPYMLGYGGNLVVLLPNDVTAFRYADAYNYDPEPMIDAGLAAR